MNNIDPQYLDSVFHVLLKDFQNASFGIDLDYRLVPFSNINTDLLTDLGIFDDYVPECHNDAVYYLLKLANFILLYSDYISFEGASDGQDQTGSD